MFRYSLFTKWKTKQNKTKQGIDYNSTLWLIQEEKEEEQ